jgi:uncharacterized DUF497 family protein
MAYNRLMRVEWDEKKRAENLTKHGIDFADAVGALLDPLGRTLEDQDARGERRYITLGRDYNERLLVVVSTEPAEDALRIISARKASPGEAHAYQD